MSKSWQSCSACRSTALLISSLVGFFDDVINTAESKPTSTSRVWILHLEKTGGGERQTRRKQVCTADFGANVRRYRPVASFVAMIFCGYSHPVNMQHCSNHGFTKMASTSLSSSCFRRSRARRFLDEAVAKLVPLLSFCFAGLSS